MSNANKRKMKEVSNLQELLTTIEKENYYYRNNEFDSFQKLQSDAIEHFKSITSGWVNEEDYYQKFGLEVGECHHEEVKTEKYYDTEFNNTLTVYFIECYLDSGVSAEDYFYGFYITGE